MAFVRYTATTPIDSLWTKEDVANSLSLRCNAFGATAGHCPVGEFSCPFQDRSCSSVEPGDWLPLLEEVHDDDK